MKKSKLSILILGAVGCLLVTSCGKADPMGYKKSHTSFYSYDPKTFNYAFSNQGEDSAHFANFVDGLYEGDRLGITYKPALAVGEPVKGRWSIGGDEGLEYTVTVKRDIPWVNSKGKIVERYGNLKPSDFVSTAMKSLNQQLNNEADVSAYMYINFLRGAQTYYMATGQNANAPFEGVVGLIADDVNYTIKYQLIEELSLESFKSALSYSCFLPINDEFYNDVVRQGFKFGSVEDPDTILYNGAYTIKNMRRLQSYEYQANPHYWDKDSVTTKTIKLIRYPETGGLDTARRYFENGETDGFSPTMDDTRGWTKYVTGENGEGTYDNPANPLTQVIEGTTSPTIWYNSFNFRRVDSDPNGVETKTKNTLKGVSTNKDAYEKVPNTLNGSYKAQMENTQKALRNRYFRLGIQHSYPRSLDMTTMTPQNPNQWLRNNMTMPEFVDVRPGVDYTDEIAKHYATFENENPHGLTGALAEKYTNHTPESAKAKLADSSDAFYDIELAAFYFEKAKAELTAQGVVWPVMVMDPYPYSADGQMTREEYEKFYNGLKSGEVPGSKTPEWFRADYGKMKDYMYYVTVGMPSTTYLSAMDDGFFDMMTIGWTPDYADPLTYVQTHCTGGMLSDQMNKLPKENPLTSQIFGNIDSRLAEASEIGKQQDVSGRLSKIAEAEYFMVHHEAVVLPIYAAFIGTSLTVSKIEPYLMQRNPVGLGREKYKGLKVRNSPFTNDERAALYAKFLEEKASALAAITG